MEAVAQWACPARRARRSHAPKTRLVVSATTRCGASLVDGSLEPRRSHPELYYKINCVANNWKIVVSNYYNTCQNQHPTRPFSEPKIRLLIVAYRLVTVCFNNTKTRHVVACILIVIHAKRVYNHTRTYSILSCRWQNVLKDMFYCGTNDNIQLTSL